MNPKRRAESGTRGSRGGDNSSDPFSVEDSESFTPPSGTSENRVVRPTRLRQSKPPGVLFQRSESISLPDLESEWGIPKTRMGTFEWSCFILLSSLLVGAIVWWVYPATTKKSPQVAAEKVERTPVVEPPPGDSAGVLIDRITQAVQTYAQATTIDELLAVCRHPERVRPLMVDHYARQPLVALGSARILATQMLTLGDHSGLWMWMVTLELENSEKINLIVETKQGEQARIDWETAVTYQPRDWDEFLQTRPQGILLDFRVYVTPDDLFTHEFDDPREWDCYRLTAPEKRDHAFAYVKSDSPTARLMRSWFKQYPGKPARMILCLSIPQGLSSPRGVVIDHAKSARWIYVVPPIGQ